jgi:hypothetical protein
MPKKITKTKDKKPIAKKGKKIIKKFSKLVKN